MQSIGYMQIWMALLPYLKKWAQNTVYQHS